MRFHWMTFALLGVALAGFTAEAAAVDGRGAPAALFYKNQLTAVGGVGDTLSLSDYPNRVVVLFLMEPN